jgi:hypothetical protein
MTNRKPILWCVALLVAACFCAAAGAAPVGQDPHRQLDDILHGPMYQAWTLRQAGHIPDIDTSAWHLADWIKSPFRAIGRFLGWLFWHHGTSGMWGSGSSAALPTILELLGWVIALMALLLIGVLLFQAIRSSRRPDTAMAVLSRQQIQDALESGNALALGPAEWLDEAQRLAAEQNFRAVYRALYLALLSGLHTAGKIEHNRGRTNWIYVQHYRGPAEERDTFGQLTELFDRVWYGRKGAEDRNIDQLRNTVATLIRRKDTP